MKQKGIKRKIGRRGVLVVALIIASVMIVSGALIPYFGKIVTTADVVQSVTIDGHPYNDAIEHEVLDPIAGCCFCWDHTIENNACEGIRLDWENTDILGIDITIYEPGSCCDHILESLEVDVLDGQAQWDDFEVYVDGILVYTYAAVGGTPETWMLHTIDLTPFQLICCGPHLINIVCTAVQPWQYFNPYGELAVDSISLYCEGHVLCDSVDIGKPASEAGHSLVGWGPIEPANTGGAYGGIDDCRVTWFWTAGDIMPNSAWCTADNPDASVVLTCEDCYNEPECDCEHESMDLPFYLDSGETIDICYCIKFDMMLKPGLYTITSKLVPAIIL